MDRGTAWGICNLRNVSRTAILPLLIDPTSPCALSGAPSPSFVGPLRAKRSRHMARI